MVLLTSRSVNVFIIFLFLGGGGDIIMNSKQRTMKFNLNVYLVL